MQFTDIENVRSWLLSWVRVGGEGRCVHARQVASQLGVGRLRHVLGSEGHDGVERLRPARSEGARTRPLQHRRHEQVLGVRAWRDRLTSQTTCQTQLRASLLQYTSIHCSQKVIFKVIVSLEISESIAVRPGLRHDRLRQVRATRSAARRIPSAARLSICAAPTKQGLCFTPASCGDVSIA